MHSANNFPGAKHAAGDPLYVGVGGQLVMVVRSGVGVNVAVDNVKVGRDDSVVESSEADDVGNGVAVAWSWVVETTVSVMDGAELAGRHFRPGAAETAVANSRESGRARRVA